ncbi:hypothetical protein MsAg5_13010 [Methanosarcinaceae archaeon Ag5]|uniref:Uncharacterized protein n=1 Tax=Methanolapillus africanus TaxID=3028297 RepID=A0AAE4MKA1_9EURY|nr:hypothetical protein [Methanosarcinaceae archaeon Ag5]
MKCDCFSEKRVELLATILEEKDRLKIRVKENEEIDGVEFSNQILTLRETKKDGEATVCAGTDLIIPADVRVRNTETGKYRKIKFNRVVAAYCPFCGQEIQEGDKE